MKTFQYAFWGLIITSLTLATNIAFAKPPYVDYLYTSIEWPLGSCLHDSRKTMRSVGFTETGSTGYHELVGAKGNYKGLIVCIDADDDHVSEMTLFMVSGPSYKQAVILNKKLKTYWDNL